MTATEQRVLTPWHTRLKEATWLAAAMLAGGLLSPAVLAQYQPVVGQPHPMFVLPRISDRMPVSLSQFRGKKVLLIHFASW